MTGSSEKYGPWALVAGASEGIGAAFAQALAAQGLNLVLIARRAAPLEVMAADIRESHGVDVKTATLDLAKDDFLPRLVLLSAGLDIGLVIFNATASYVGRFNDQSFESKQQIIDLNCRAVTMVADHFGQKFTARGKGGLVLMSSLAGLQGSPLVATYGATKSFMRVLAEGLWDEWQADGVDVLACVAGATDTPGYKSSNPKGKAPTQDADAVARTALRALGKKPVVITGFVNRLAAFVVQRLLPKPLAIRFMGQQTRRLYD